MKIPANIQQAIQAYYAERATPDDVAALEKWFREDEAHIKIFAEHGMLEWQMLCEHEKQDAAAIMTILREAEDNAEPVLVELDKPTPRVRNASADDGLTLGQLRSVAGYVLGKALRSKAGVIGSIAAVVLIGAMLYVTLFSQGNPPTTQNIADQTPAGPAAQDSTIVATLTAEHNAAWDRRPGQDLYAGQRFTLSEGFAEITTASGAVAILEAPATIELLDNPNAVHLDAGILVGVCETESSKGFLVSTPQMQIVDLGTRFGVAVQSSGETTAEVFEGSVVAKPNKPSQSGFEQRVLQASDQLTLDAAGLPTTQTVYANLFDRSALINIGVLSTEDPVRWSPNPFDSALYREWPKSDEVMLIEELRGHRLAQGLPLDLHEPRTYTRFDQTQAIELPPGTTIRTYVVMFNPQSQDLRSMTGSISFDGQILGIVADEEQNKRFLSTIGEHPRLARGGTNAWMEPQRSGASQDQITIHSDLRTLSYHFNVQGTCDMFRVIVLESEADSQGENP